MILTEMPEQFKADAARTALDAATQISLLVRDAMDHRVVAPFAGYCAFFSSTVHIHGAFSKNAQLEASSKQNLAYNVKYLTKMKRYWGMFNFFTENLRDLYRLHADAARSGGTSGKESEHAIFQYGDWFDRYPHGVSETDYEEPSTDVKNEPGSDAVLGQKSDLQTVEEFFSKLSTPNRIAPGQPQAIKRVAKKRHPSKSEGSKTAQPAPQPMSTQQVENNLTVMQQPFPQNMSNFTSQAAAFTQEFQPPQNVASMPLQPFMSQLDRQMVLNSYAANSNQGMLPGMDTSMIDIPSNTNLGNLAMSNWGNNMSLNNNGFWGDPSTAWFMPFNMDPANVPNAVGDDHIFGGSLDWSSNYGDFGDLAGITTGLTPQLDDESVGQHGSAGQAGLDNVE